MSIHQKETLVAFSFVAPSFIGYFLTSLIPILASFVLSAYSWSGGSLSLAEFVGFYNYVQLFKDDSFTIALFNTFYFALGTMPLTTVLSLGLALLLNKAFRGRNFVRSACFFPHVASMVTIAGIWNMLFNPEMGPVNTFLAALGVQNLPGWASDINWAMPMVILCAIWKSVGYFMIIYLAALQGIPEELYEAARIDGASAVQSFQAITVPMLTPTTFFVVMMLTINCFQNFDLIYVLTKGGPGRATTVLVTNIFTRFRDFRYGMASAVAIVLFVIVLIITVIQFRMEKKWVSYM